MKATEGAACFRASGKFGANALGALPWIVRPHQNMPKQPPPPYSHADFARMLCGEFPDLRQEVEDQDGLLHLEMAVFARHTRAAIEGADWSTLKRCVHLAHELWQRADPELSNALNVSYLEHLEFNGPNGEAAWSRFTRELQQGWKEMQAYWQELARQTNGTGGKPRRA